MNKVNFEARRERFFHEIEGGVAIIPAQPEVLRNDDVHYKFRQDSSFYYLTGFEEPDAIAVFRNIAGVKEYQLYVRPRDLEKEIWNGRRAGVEGALQKYSANKAFNLDQFQTNFLEILKGAESVYYTLGARKDRTILAMLDSYKKTQGRKGHGLLPIFDVHNIISEMRIRKSTDEIERLRVAGKISAKAHLEVMCRTRPGIYEYQLEGLIEYVFRNAGSERVGYNSIVASGENATILHYVENNRLLETNDLLLVDAGAEFNYLTADITRTFPVSGKMNPEQAEIYQIVLDVQKACIQMAKPGITIVAIHNFAVEQLTEAMLRLKFLEGNKEDLIKGLAYKRFYPHGTGHLLGMDVHDAGRYDVNGMPRQLEPGMVFTIEPGFYIQPYDQSVPEKYRGIGVRIEDDVVITQNGCEVLTSDVVKEIKDMADVIGSKSWLDP